MTLTLSGSGTIGGLVAGGLPDATVTAADLASGAARTNFGAGAVLQVVSVTKTDTFSSSSASWVDITGLSVAITPSATTSKLLVVISLHRGCSMAAVEKFRLTRNGTAIGVGDAASTRIPATMAGYYGASNVEPQIATLAMNFMDTPNATTATTYTMQGSSQGSGETFYVNRSFADVDSTMTPRCISSITVMEIAG